MNARKEEIRKILEKHREIAVGEEDFGYVLQDWFSSGIEPDEIDKWLSVRCFFPEAVKMLEKSYGLTHEYKHYIELNGVNETIGYHFASENIKLSQIRTYATFMYNNDIPVEEAIDRAFFPEFSAEKYKISTEDVL